jgi:hypothetical protein
LAAELQKEGRRKGGPWTLLHMDNATPHKSRSKSTLAMKQKIAFQMHCASVCSLNVVPLDFFLFG